MKEAIKGANFLIKWKSEALFVMFGFLIVSVNQILNWPLLQFWNISGIDQNRNRFNDLTIVLRAAECYDLHGLDVYSQDSYCGNYLYGTFLLKFINFFQLGGLSVYVMGMILALVFLVTFAYIGKQDFLRNSILLSLFIAFAPPFHLMVQRGHIDILMFSLVVISSFLIYKKKTLFGLGLIFFTVLVKFYTAPLLLYFSFRINNIKYRVLSLGLFVVSLIFIWSDLKSTPVKPLQDYNGRIWGLFGWESIVRRINETATFQFSYLQVLVFSLAINAISYLVVYLILRKYDFFFLNQIMFKNSEENAYVFSALAIVSVTCYFAGLNYDFRLIFPVTAGILLLVLTTVTPKLKFSLLALILGVSWLSFESGGLEIFGDVMISLLISLYVEIFRRNVWFVWREKTVKLTGSETSY